MAAGHRLGMKVWIGRREQTRRHDGGVLGDLLEPSERRLYLGGLGPSADDLVEVDAIWYVRGKMAFLFEVEWTAMLGEPLLRRHARIPPERRHRPVPRRRPGAGRSRPLQARAVAAAADTPSTPGRGTSSRSDHLRAFLAREPLDLADLEPYLGLDPRDRTRQRADAAVRRVTRTTRRTGRRGGGALG